MPALSSSLKQLYLYPNPAQEAAQIHFNLDKEGAVSIILYDVTGKIQGVVTSDRSLLPGEHQFTIDLKGLPSGNYFVGVICDGANSVLKLTKE